MRYLIKLILIIFISLNNIVLSQELLKNEKVMIELASELRCVVCQNQSLLESDSELAKDLKNLILIKLSEGKNKDEIKKFLVERYGEFILFKPLMNKNNLVLWFAPIISLLVFTILALRKLNLYKRKNQQNKYSYIFIICGAILLLILIFVLRKIFQKRKKIAQKKREIENTSKRDV